MISSNHINIFVQLTINSTRNNYKLLFVQFIVNCILYHAITVPSRFTEEILHCIDLKQRFVSSDNVIASRLPKSSVYSAQYFTTRDVVLNVLSQSDY